MTNLALSWWVVRLRGGGAIYFPPSEGDAISTMLLQQRTGDGRPLFVEAVDVSGAPTTIGVDEIVTMEFSTPESRVADADPDGTLEQIRRWALDSAKRKWQGAEEYE